GQRRVGRGGESVARPEGAAHVPVPHLRAGLGPRSVPASGPLPATKAARHGRITALITARDIRSQTELAALLADEGLPVTQATLSRDLEELGAFKLRGVDGGAGKYVIPEDGHVRPMTGGTSRLERLLAELLLSYNASGNI